MADPTRSSHEICKSSSYQKLNKPDDTVTENSSLSGYRFINIEDLVSFINLFPCPSCGETKDNLFHINEQLTGINTKLTFECSMCKNISTFSHKENVNLRFQVAMYGIGCHENKGRRFLAAMDMPQPVSSVRAAVYKTRIHNATKQAADMSMKQAAEELQAVEATSEVTVSCDGTWQRRGFSSKNGISTCLSVSNKVPAKVLDVDILTNHCDTCCKMAKKLGDDEFAKWLEGHKHLCKKNHDGSAGAMEPAGLKKIFRRSEQLYNLKYTNYLGDGDSKSYKQIAEAVPPIYEGTSITKLECCGHVQKRMGKKLLDKVAENKNVSFTEGGKKYKGIGGKDRLTKVAIKRIQGHYGGAIRSNVGNLDKMKKAIWAIWEHRKGIHVNCGEWCTGQIKNMLPNFVMEIIKPVFVELSSDTLLKKCLHGGTQNANEAFHHIIWEKCPKVTFVGKDRLEIGVFDAVIVYNEGEMGRLAIFRSLGLNCGYHCISAFKKFDTTRIKAAQKFINAPLTRGKGKKNLVQTLKMTPMWQEVTNLTCFLNNCILYHIFVVFSKYGISKKIILVYIISPKVFNIFMSYLTHTSSNIIRTHCAKIIAVSPFLFLKQFFFHPPPVNF
ncbi:uncharacterized protein LOC131949201 [Physella acuta]|uniref:uncharacterized protein LOC131949201 n=1 Tax=Physella acuta TaxID=109671 RepID=UPI0027DC6700|nr:uncharacterized protein LOC131949201 [Physella acuta]